jgi:hypothetical protein
MLLAFAFFALAADELVLTIPVSPETPEGQRLIAVRAVEHCAGRYPRLGQYRFVGNETIAPDGTRQSSFEVRQELQCAEAPSARSTVPAAPADWRASPADEREIRNLTQAYFSLVDGGAVTQVREFCAPSRQRADEPEACVSRIEGFRRESGAPGQHRLVAVTWYVNPEGAPTPGIYVAVDYERSYEKLLLNCGYVVWFRDSAGKYVLVREESGTLRREDSDGSPEFVAQARSLMHCRGS